MTGPTDADRAKAADLVKYLLPGRPSGHAPVEVETVAALIASERAAAVADLRARMEPILRQVETAEDESTTAERRLVRRLRAAVTDTTAGGDRFA